MKLLSLACVQTVNELSSKTRNKTMLTVIVEFYWKRRRVKVLSSLILSSSAHSGLILSTEDDFEAQNQK